MLAGAQPRCTQRTANAGFCLGTAHGVAAVRVIPAAIPNAFIWLLLLFPSSEWQF